MSNIIKLLPDHVANQIAAGEVVQRPASVVKELLENAVDAQSKLIKLIVKDAGKSLIQVVDDGIGMNETDARLSLERHATSKISTAEDLFKLQTKGFRGEALASIAAIAHLDIKTKTEADEIGTHIQVEGSKVLSQTPSVTSKGTSIAVKHLFFNIPARRNFLKSDQVELKHIIDEFQRVALAHPDLNFEFHHNNTELFKLQACNLRQRIVGIMGAKSNEKLVPVKEKTDLIEVNGFIGKPEFARRSRGEQFIFVNHRFIKDHYLNHAIIAGFDGLLKDKTYPSYFLYLTINPERIDINIHPTKTEIKFDDQHAIYSIIQSSIKHSLGQFNIAPILDFEKDQNLDTSYQQQKSPAKLPSIEVDRNYNPFKTEVNSRPFQPKSKPIKNWEDLYTTETPKTPSEPVEFESKLFNETEFASQTKAFQLSQKYIVTAFKSGLILINQHRAHFRILYEELLKNITEKPAASQQLLFPLELELDQKTKAVFTGLRESIENTGFRFNVKRNKTLVINGIPDMIQETDVSGILDHIFSAFDHEIPQSSFESNTILAQALAKNMAIRTGVNLEQTELHQIIDTLFACKDYLKTPDGKQIYINLSLEDITKKFA